MLVGSVGNEPSYWFGGSTTEKLDPPSLAEDESLDVTPLVLLNSNM
jgi:hypothetical protein